jgi:phage shock protein A
MIDDPKRRLDDARSALARLEKQFDHEKQVAVEWEKKAMLAAKAGNDDLAKKALIRKRAHEKVAVGYEAQARDQKHAVSELEKDVHASRAASTGSSVAVPSISERREAKRDIQDDLARTLKEIDARDVDDELIALKEKMGLVRRKTWIH